VKDRTGHDSRYAIDLKKIKNVLKWKSVHKFKEAIKIKVQWYLNNFDGCQTMLKRSNCDGEKIG